MVQSIGVTQANGVRANSVYLMRPTSERFFIVPGCALFIHHHNRGKCYAKTQKLLMAHKSRDLHVRNGHVTTTFTADSSGAKPFRTKAAPALCGACQALLVSEWCQTQHQSHLIPSVKHS